MDATEQPDFEGLPEVLETLAALLTFQEVLALRPSPALRERLRELLDKNRAEGLSSDEEREWDAYQCMEHLVRIAKAKALGSLRRA